MVRSLLLVATLGFMASIAFFALAFATGVHDLRDLNWGDWDSHGHHRHGPAIVAGGPMTTRTLAWPGGDSLSVDVEAEISYVQGPANSIVVTGSKTAVDNLVLDDDSLTYDRPMRASPRLKIVMTAPDVAEFTLNGSQNLRIEGYDHPQLEVSIHGSSDVVALGRTDELELKIAGAGDADFSGLPSRDADIGIFGSGKATVAPRDNADVKIAGSGDVILTTRPAHLDSKIAGSGRIVQPETAPLPAPALAPAPPANKTV